MSAVVTVARVVRRYGAAFLADVANAALGPRCAITGDRVYPRDRGRHQALEHFGEGPCA